MLPSLHRLPKEEISAILRRGLRVRVDALELVYRKTSGLSRFGFVVSTKIDKRAVKRNRMRRVLSESVRHLLPSLSRCDGIFIARKNISELSQVDAEKLVVDVLVNAKLLNPESGSMNHEV